MPTVFIGVGSNLGDRASHLEQAKRELLGHSEVRNLRYSSVYETEPVDAPGGKYLNAVWSFETDLNPRCVLDLLRGIENELGRVRHVRNEPRGIDLDLLAYGDTVLQDKNLTVPHPRMAEREFVLRPFCDLAPGWAHPVLKKTAKELLREKEQKTL